MSNNSYKNYESVMLKETRSLLRIQAKGFWRLVTEETGITYSQLASIAYKTNANPGVNTVEFLHNYLRGRFNNVPGRELKK